MDNRLLTSAEAAQLAGVGQTAIKRWADTGVLPCLRTAGGHRRFRREDVEHVMRAGDAVDDWTEWIDLLAGDGDPHTVQGRLLEERARRGSWHETAAALGDLVTEIGRRWEAGRLSVIEEHLASAALQRALAAATASLPVRRSAPRALLATAEGDDHTVGLSLVEVCLREAGWRTEWGGAHTRTSDLIDRVAGDGLSLVAISASALMSAAAPLAAQAVAVGDACRAAHVRLALGGSGAWPDPPPHGIRFRSLAVFYDYAVAERSGIEGR